MRDPRIRALGTLLLVATGCAATTARVGDEPPPNDAEAGADANAPPPASSTDGGPATDGSPPPSEEPDPTKPGPYAITELDRSANVASTGDAVPIHVVVPTGKGPFPAVVFAHGFQIPSTQYYGTIRRLATFGYVAMTADYPAGFTSSSNVRDAKNLIGALDWAASAPELAGTIEAKRSAVMGHSRGGKAAVLAASLDARFVAVLGVDPVDAKSPLGCDATTECPDAREALAKLSIPSAMLGETTDSSAGGFGQACAPADGNFETFYAKARSPSYAVDVAGANHMSFLDDPSSCGFTCSVCKPASAKQSDVLSLTRAFAVAFFGRHLRGVAGYATYLDGPQAKALWVTTGLATIESK